MRLFKDELCTLVEEFVVSEGPNKAIAELFRRYWGQFNTSCDMPRESLGFEILITPPNFDCNCDPTMRSKIGLKFTIMREYTIGPRIKEGGLCMMCMHFDGCTRPQHHNGPHRLPE
jgi:hypothetical protein